VNFDLGDILATLEHPSRRFRRFIRTFRFLQALEKFAGSLVARGGAPPKDNQPSFDLLQAIRVKQFVRIVMGRLATHVGFKA
jgi:hypothetical protein